MEPFLSDKMLPYNEKTKAREKRSLLGCGLWAAHNLTSALRKTPEENVAHGQEADSLG